jgi:FkbM family methyltransferase
MPPTTQISKALVSLGLGPGSKIRVKANSWLSLRKSKQLAVGMKPRLSYSQLGEDAILQANLPDQVGFYVDIGSGHPTEGSNTYSLYLKGWRGLLVDPIDSNIVLSRAVRPLDESVVGLCSSITGGSVEFFEFDVYQYSTMLPERAREVEALGHTIKSKYQLSKTRISDLMPKVLPPGPTVLSIDVEGAELDVLNGNSWELFKPDLICVEEWEPPLKKPTEVSNYLWEKGYVLIAVTGFSSVYQLSRDRSALPVN